MPVDPDYAGEPVTVTVTGPVDDDGAPVNGSNATAAITIDAYDDDAIVDAADVPWDLTATPPAWRYVWDSTGVAPGNYRGRIAVTPSGSVASWVYVDIVLEAPPTGPRIPYGATVDDVKALLPHRRWTAGTKPDMVDVERFIVSVASILDLHVDDLPARLLPAVGDRLVALARRAVVLGAAAHAEAAGTPERANPNSTSSYAEWLMERYLEAVAAAESFAADLAGGETPGSVDEPEPAWSFPDPANFALRGL